MAALSLGLFGSLCLSGEMKPPGDMKPKSRRSKASRLEQELERELKAGFAKCMTCNVQTPL